MFRLLAFLIIFPLGLAMIYYREKVERWTGPIAFAEEKFGNGGTFTLIALIGVMIAVLALLYAMGALQIIGRSILELVPFF